MLVRALFRGIAGYIRGQRNGGVDDLIRAVYRQALLDLQPFVQGGEVLPDVWHNAPVERRAKALSAALFVADYMPFPASLRVIRRLLSLLRGRDEAEELLLFAKYGEYPWRDEIEAVCFRCGRRPVTWRQIFTPPDNLPPAYRWRYDIPENHVPLCRTCGDQTFASADEEIRRLWGMAVWGERFDAWERLHRAFIHDNIPHWEKDTSPLWPPAFGGKDWASGQGILLPRYPRLYSVQRLAVHRDAARALLHRWPLVRHELQKRSLLLRIAYPQKRRQERKRQRQTPSQTAQSRQA